MNMLDKVLSKPVVVKPTDFELPPPEKHEGYEGDPFEGEPEDDGEYFAPDFDDEDESEAEPIEVEASEDSEEREVKWHNLYQNKRLGFPYRAAGVEMDSKLELLSRTGNWVTSSYELVDLLKDQDYMLAWADDFDEEYAEALEKHGYTR